MFKHVVTWLSTEARPLKAKSSRGTWAGWLGRKWAHWTYAVRVEPTWLELNLHEVPLADLHSSLSGLRVVQMSDFHCGHQVTPAYLGEAVDLALAQKPDVAVLTGDFIHKGFKHIEAVARVLGRLSAPHGVFAVLGNHDFSVRNALGIRRYRHLHQAVADALSARGIRVLRNETVTLSQAGARLHLTGVEDLWSRVCDLESAFDGGCLTVPRIVLAHNPTTIELLDGRRCDLMLSGHTHGGQVKLPVVGPLALGPRGRRYAAGFFQRDRSLLYVNKGVGFGVRLRYGVRPEVAVFVLRAAAGT